MGETIYKIAPKAEWEAAVAAGSYHGSAADLRDGFIHFSLADQVEGTLRKHFAGQRELLLISVDADRLGAALRYEPSRGGQLFPHLYGALATHLVETVVELPPVSNETSP